MACALTLLLNLFGCNDLPPETPAVSDSAERGPLKFTVSVSPAEVWLGDPITVDLRVHTPEDHLVEFPPDDAFGGLQINRVDKGEPQPGVAGGLDWRRTYTALSFTSGTLEIPPLVVKYARVPPGGRDPEAAPAWDNELVTGTLKIEVRSALTSQDSTTRPRDITGTVLPEWRMKPIHWIVLGAGLVLLGLVAFLVVVLMRRRRARGAPQILPEVWAMREFAALAAADHIREGRVREYYYGLTHIVCTYIELKFGLAAPEMTTEEFLTMLARNRGALPYEADRLREFLEACDIVKYAAFNPKNEDAEQALLTARAFVDATAAAATRAAARAAVDRAKSASGGQAA